MLHSFSFFLEFCCYHLPTFNSYHSSFFFGGGGWLGGGWGVVGGGGWGVASLIVLMFCKKSLCSVLIKTISRQVSSKVCFNFLYR